MNQSDEGIIKVRVICKDDDKDVAINAINQGLEKVDFKPLFSPSFHPSRYFKNDILVYQDFIRVTD